MSHVWSTIISDFTPQLAACVFILFDIASGILKALKVEGLQSSKMKNGLYHKSAFIMLLVLGVLGDKHADIFGLQGIPVASSVAAFVCITELVSILENLNTVNPQIGKAFKFFNVSRETEQEK